MRTSNGENTPNRQLLIVHRNSDLDTTFYTEIFTHVDHDYQIRKALNRKLKLRNLKPFWSVFCVRNKQILSPGICASLSIQKCVQVKNRKFSPSSLLQLPS